MSPLGLTNLWSGYTCQHICTELCSFLCGFVAATVTRTALWQLHLVIYMHTALTSDCMLYSGIQSPVASSSQPHFQWAASIVHCTMCPHTWPASFTAHLTCWDKAASVVECYISVNNINKPFFLALFTRLNVDECLYKWLKQRSLYRRHTARVHQNPL